MLEYQSRIWQTYPEHVEIVLVDDGSPVGARAEEVMARMPKLTCRFKLARVLVDLPWNQCGARNLGWSHASSEWAVNVDIDHIIPASEIDKILNASLNEHAIYSFLRREHLSKNTISYHWETRLMTRKMFWGIGGFDESFCGHYAFSERNWLRQIECLNIETLEFPAWLELVGKEIPDSSTLGLTRKKGRDDAAWGEIIEWKNKNSIPIEKLKLPWKLVFDSTQPMETTA